MRISNLGARIASDDEPWTMLMDSEIYVVIVCQNLLYEYRVLLSYDK